MPTANPKTRLFIVLKIILAASLTVLNVGTALAGNDPPPATPPAEPSSAATDRQGYATFPVGKYLTVGKIAEDGSGADTSGEAGVTKGSQDQSYLDSGNPTASLILQAINFIALISASLSFLAIVVAGFLMMSSAGNENQRTKGIEILTKAVVGLVITLSAYFIVAFVQNLLFETAPK